MSFGAVNELFASKKPTDFMNEMNALSENFHPDDAVDASVTPTKSNGNFLSVASDNNSHEKRLSYGGVGLLFDANADQNIDDAENIFNPHSQPQPQQSQQYTNET